MANAGLIIGLVVLFLLIVAAVIIVIVVLRNRQTGDNGNGGNGTGNGNGGPTGATGPFRPLLLPASFVGLIHPGGTGPTGPGGPGCNPPTLMVTKSEQDITQGNIVIQVAFVRPALISLGSSYRIELSNNGFTTVSHQMSVMASGPNSPLCNATSCFYIVQGSDFTPPYTSIQGITLRMISVEPCGSGLPSNQVQVEVLTDSP